MKSTKRFTIWTDEINIDDWREDYCEINEISPEEFDENACYLWAAETNNIYLDDERINLNIEMPGKIIAFADIGRWNGRVNGYKEIGYNIADCLYCDCDYYGAEWYIKNGDFCFKGIHHDSTDYITYRMLRPDLTDKQIDNFYDKLYAGNVNIEYYTKSIAPPAAITGSI